MKRSNLIANVFFLLLLAPANAFNVDTTVLTLVGLCGDNKVDDLGDNVLDATANTFLPDWDPKDPWGSTASLLIPLWDCVTDEKGPPKVRQLDETARKTRKLRGVKGQRSA
ncbi:expressed unknown protein [Seminavis robusta]|uniref:Uncharacterized protein n=1 Tax=Seminavis robusta TaxID=568900 RepID=A0A9N8ESW0_9STRA|nr:expressed unknown protein [Seminavis robusta]|eukprot:Sro1676_g290530.1 n/a (111) ;mRNA; r:23656-23988